MATVVMDKWATLKMFAPDFDATVTYAVGVWVNYGGKLWKCHTAVETAGVWTGATNWTEVPITDFFDDVSDIKTDIAALVATSCEIVVTCVTQDDVTVTGQTVTLYNRSSGAVYDTLAYNGQPVTFKVPPGFRYLVEVSSTLSGHFAPTSAEGIVTTNTTAVTLTYSDTSHITTYADVKGAVESITTVEEGRAALVGIEIADTWTDENGTVYSDPMIVQDVQEVQDAQGNTHLAAMLMRKYATKYNFQFDAPEISADAYASEATAIIGIYYWGYGKDYAQATTYAVNAFCGYKGGIWKCTTAVTGSEAFDPAKWLLMDAKEYLSTSTYAVGDYAKYGGKVYECATAVETPEAFDTNKWTQVLSSGTFQSGARTALNLAVGATVPYSAWTLILKNDINDISIQNNGSNGWWYSAIRQYLNSDGAVGEWWNPAHVGDCHPNELATVRGYKAGCSSALLQYAKPMRVLVYSANQSPQYTVDVFWIPSLTQMFGGGNNGEGYTFQKVQDNCNSVSGWTTASTTNTNARVYRRVSATGSAVNAWLRSITGDTSYHWLLSSNGSCPYNGYAKDSYAGLPCCAIY